MIIKPVVSVEVKVGPLLQVDVFLTAQYFAVIGRGGHLEPEKRLMLAVWKMPLAVSGSAALPETPGGRCLSHEAEEWMREENKDWLFSFNNICEALGFDPDHMRKELLRWKERKLAGSSKTEIYCWTRQGQEHKRGVVKSGRTEQRSRRAPAHWRFCSQGGLKS